MRSSGVLQRAAKSYGWYSKFMKEGNEGFKRFLPPTAFDWCQPNELGELPKRPHAFFDIRIENEELERIHFELASDIVPKTVDNFKKLCLGLGTKFGGYKGTKIFYTSKGVSMMGGDIVTETSSGTGNHSAGDSRYFNDENYIIPHTERGLVRCVPILHPLKRHCPHRLLTPLPVLFSPFRFNLHFNMQYGINRNTYKRFSILYCACSNASIERKMRDLRTDREGHGFYPSNREGKNVQRTITPHRSHHTPHRH
jgi:Cyclophilin type peptidyl-prolyl cis-trans isomerase/CLD